MGASGQASGEASDFWNKMVDSWVTYLWSGDSLLLLFFFKSSGFMLVVLVAFLGIQGSLFCQYLAVRCFPKRERTRPVFAKNRGKTNYRTNTKNSTYLNNI